MKIEVKKLSLLSDKYCSYDANEKEFLASYI